MNHISNLTQANIHNLTSLWKTASLPFKTYQKKARFSYCEVQESDWPNRLWFHTDADVTPDSTEKAREIISEASSNLALIYWDIFGSDSSRYVENAGFNKNLELTGMSLKLGEPFDHQNRLALKRVSNPQEAILWAELYPQAFGYRIGKHVVENSLETVDFYLAKYRDRPAGTAIIYHTGDITGIHGVGVIPELRRNGFAKEMMKIILNESIKSGYTYATLQASRMGKGLYLKLGFDELFTMKSYYSNPASNKN